MVFVHTADCISQTAAASLCQMQLHVWKGQARKMHTWDTLVFHLKILALLCVRLQVGSEALELNSRGGNLALSFPVAFSDVRKVPSVLRTDWTCKVCRQASRARLIVRETGLAQNEQTSGLRQSWFGSSKKGDTENIREMSKTKKLIVSLLDLCESCTSGDSISCGMDAAAHCQNVSVQKQSALANEAENYNIGFYERTGVPTLVTKCKCYSKR